MVRRLPALFRRDRNLPTLENRLHSLVNDYSDPDESEVIYPVTPPPRPCNPTPSPIEYEFWNPNKRVQSGALADDEYKEEFPEQPAQSPTEQERVQSFEQNIINGHNLARELFEDNINDQAIDHFALFHLQDAAWHLLQALRHIRGQPPFPAPGDRALHFPEWVEVNLNNALQALSSSHAGHPNFGLYADRLFRDKIYLTQHRLVHKFHLSNPQSLPPPPLGYLPKHHYHLQLSLSHLPRLYLKANIAKAHHLFKEKTWKKLKTQCRSLKGQDHHSSGPVQQLRSDLQHIQEVIGKKKNNPQDTKIKGRNQEGRMNQKVEDPEAKNQADQVDRVDLTNQEAEAEEEAEAGEGQTQEQANPTLRNPKKA
ncbi:hypothetical protein BN946_scf184642.g4 [Trametes cinnabarina]|uniref:Uncharacterized protein n=1 Tax=Pycnoporus cinnabarinus TaxID=5643 RepID=A0A060SPX6_PYCCI|nr:hypothetical protein BN946_scf184642.g4 [Trametes cinnabarina]